MKNHSLPALAALAVLAIACQAQAQSSLQVFGELDAAVSHGSGSRSRTTLLSSGSSTSSKIGFRGTEDLGGGLRAGFWLETQVNTDSGLGQATNVNNQTTGTSTASAGTQGLTFARRSTVSLSGTWGEIRLGRDHTSQYKNRVEVDPFANVGVGASQANTGTIGGPVSSRASNMITYFLPANVLGGLYGQAQYYLGENASGVTDSGTGKSMRLGYKAGPLNVSVGGSRTTYAQTATTGDIKSVNLGVHYDFGVARLTGGLYRDKVEQLAPLTAKGYLVATAVPVGSGLVKLAFSRYGTRSGAEPTAKKLALGYVHNLSKRTALYATYARVSNSGGSAVALASSSTTPNTRSTGYDLGLKHSF